MHPPEWRLAAVADLLSIVDYIASDNPAAAQRLKDEIDTKVARLPSHPRIYRVGRVVGTREMVVRPNYIVVYSIRDSDITILRVLHATRQWP